MAPTINLLQKTADGNAWVLVTLDLDSSSFELGHAKALRQAIAEFLDLGPEAVRPIAITHWQPSVVLELPAGGAEEVIRSFERSDPRLGASLGTLPLTSITSDTFGLPGPVARKASEGRWSRLLGWFGRLPGAGATFLVALSRRDIRPFLVKALRTIGLGIAGVLLVIPVSLAAGIQWLWNRVPRPGVAPAIGKRRLKTGQQQPDRRVARLLFRTVGWVARGLLLVAVAGLVNVLCWILQRVSRNRFLAEIGAESPLKLEPRRLDLGIVSMLFRSITLTISGIIFLAIGVLAKALARAWKLIPNDQFTAKVGQAPWFTPASSVVGATLRSTAFIFFGIFARLARLIEGSLRIFRQLSRRVFWQEIGRGLVDKGRVRQEIEKPSSGPITDDERFYRILLLVAATFYFVVALGS